MLKTSNIWAAFKEVEFLESKTARLRMLVVEVESKDKGMMKVYVRFLYSDVHWSDLDRLLGSIKADK